MNVEEAIKGIVTWRKVIHEKNYWSNPDALSDVMAKLAVYNSYLADNKATLHKVATDTAYKVYKDCKDDGLATNAAEIEMRGQSSSERKEYEEVQFIYKATEGLISVLQTRLGVIRDQMKQEGIGQ